MKRALVEQNLSVRLLAKQFAMKIREVGARKILVTSVDPGSGKTMFVEMLGRESAILKDEKFVPLVTADLYTTSPDFFAEDLLVVDGPAFMEERGLYVLPEQWLLDFDAAVVVVAMRDTKSAELKKAIRWLRDYGIDHVWMVMNMKNVSPLFGATLQKRTRPNVTSRTVEGADNG